MQGRKSLLEKIMSLKHYLDALLEYFLKVLTALPSYFTDLNRS